jgi:hypothetical protein
MAVSGSAPSSSVLCGRSRNIAIAIRCGVPVTLFHFRSSYSFILEAEGYAVSVGPPRKRGRRSADGQMNGPNRLTTPNTKSPKLTERDSCEPPQRDRQGKRVNVDRSGLRGNSGNRTVRLRRISRRQHLVADPVKGGAELYQSVGGHW